MTPKDFLEEAKEMGIQFTFQASIDKGKGVPRKILGFLFYPEYINDDLLSVLKNACEKLLHDYKSKN